MHRIAVSTAKKPQEATHSANYYMDGCRYFVAKAGLSVGAGVCLPQGVTDIRQVVSVVVAYIDARPARMHKNFNTLALEALRNAWPCPR
jgi:Rap1a immunity proteins